MSIVNNVQCDNVAHLRLYYSMASSVLFLDILIYLLKVSNITRIMHPALFLNAASRQPSAVKLVNAQRIESFSSTVMENYRSHRACACNYGWRDFQTRATLLVVF